MNTNIILSLCSIFYCVHFTFNSLDQHKYHIRGYVKYFMVYIMGFHCYSMIFDKY